LKVLITALSEESRERLLASGIEATVVPVIRLRAVPEQIARLKAALLEGRFRSVAFMSPRALRLIGPEPGIVAKIKTMKVFAVGPTTEDSLGEHGISACGLPKRFTSAALLEMIIREWGAATGGCEIAPIAVIRSALADSSFMDGLKAAKISGEEFRVYTAVVDEGGAGRFIMELAGAEAVVFTSRSSVDILIEYARCRGRSEETIKCLRGKRLICIGPETLSGIDRIGLEAEEADVSTIDGIIRKIMEGRHLKEQTKTGILLIGHGSKEPFNKEMVEYFASMLKPEHYFVSAAFMQINEPSIEATIQRAIGAGVDRIIIQPVFLANGVHTKMDIPEALGLGRGERSRIIRSDGREVRLVYGEPFGKDPRLLEIIKERIRALEPESEKL